MLKSQHNIQYVMSKPESNNRQLDDRRIIELLLLNRELTLPKLCQLLDVNEGSMDYHLKNLIKREIVSVKKKKYGSLYSLAEKRTAISNRTSIEFAASFVFLVFGLLVFLNSPDIAIASLLISSIIGTFSTVSSATRERKEKVKTLLELV